MSEQMHDISEAYPTTKPQPSQDRSRATYEAILRAAGDVLEEVGIERFSTNLICARAGLTPPALYRYFGNKYDLLRELAARMMRAHDAVLLDWFEKNRMMPGELMQNIALMEALQSRVMETIAQFRGGTWILRAMRVVPELQELREQSTRGMAALLVGRLQARIPALATPQLRVACRLCLEYGYLATELAAGAPPAEAQLILREFARSIAGYFDASMTAAMLAMQKG